MRIPGASRVMVLSVTAVLALAGCGGGSSGAASSPPVGTVGVAPGKTPGVTVTFENTSTGEPTDDGTATDDPTPGPVQGGTVDPDDPQGVAQAYGVTLVDPVGAGMVEYGIVSFRSPSKGILCSGSDEGDTKSSVRCDVPQNTWKSLPPVPADCDFDWGLAVGVSADGRPGEMQCVSDAVGGPVVLAYGKGVLIGPILCASRTTGVECVVTSGKKHGFRVARAAFSLY